MDISSIGRIPPQAIEPEQSVIGSMILDKDGIIQSWGDSYADNVDSTHKLKIKFYIPSETLSVKKVLLNFSLEAFRAYETGAASGGSSTPTSDSGGSSSPTSAAGGDHRHQMLEYIQDINDVVSVLKTGGGSIDVHKKNETLRWFRAGDAAGGNGADLGIEAAQGNYTIYTKGASGTHTHTVTIAGHTHTVIIAAHTHGMSYGIYESTSATGVKVYVDGILRLDNGGAGYTADQANLDLSAWITTSGWHYIELSSSQLGRINAGYFTQIFLGV